MADLLPLTGRKPVLTPGAFPPIDSLPVPTLPPLNMDGATPSLGPLTPPSVANNPRMNSSAADPLVARTGDLNADIYRREHPIAPTTTLGKIGHVAAGIGNVLGNIFAPAEMALMSKTDLGNRAKIGEDQHNLQEISQQQTEADQRKQTEAQTAYTTARPQIEQAKILQKLTSSLAPKGIIATMNPDGTIDTQDDPESQAFKNQQALSAMHDATSEKDAITSEIAKNHYVPGTPQYVEEQRKLGQVDQRIHVALAGLGLRAQGLELRKENTNAALYGTDNQGKALPGAPIINGDNGPVVVGQKNAEHAITQQASVGAFNDLAGSVSHTEKALNDYFGEGGSLSDPRMAAALSDPNGVTSQVIHGWVQSGMSPRAIAALTAVKQLHEQAGILRSATKGTASEAGAQRILETVPVAGDSNDVALSKLGEVRNVQGRLAPGVTSVAGGISVKAGKGATPGSGSVKTYNPKTGRLE